MLPLCLLLAPVAYGAEAPTDNTSDQPQVVIEATKMNMEKLRQEVLNLEYRFYQRYNSLNAVRKYDVDCAKEAATGWRIRRMQCRPRFQSNAQTEEAHELMIALGASPNPTASGTVLTNNPLAVPPPVSPGSHTPATVAIETERPGFKKNMSEVVNRSPELEKMLEAHAAAWRQYTDVYRKLNGSDPVADTNFPEPAGTSPPAPADDDEEEQ